MVQVDIVQDFETEGPGSVVLEMVYAGFPLSRANVISLDDQLALLTTVAYDKGAVTVTAYDLVDIAEFYQHNLSYIDTLFTNVLGKSKVNRPTESVHNDGFSQYRSANNMINTGSMDRLPDIPLYAMEIIIYIFLVGLGTYILLRQRGLNRYYRSIIVLSSLTLTAIIYLMGSKTRFQGTLYTHARFLDTPEDMVNETMYLNI